MIRRTQSTAGPPTGRSTPQAAVAVVQIIAGLALLGMPRRTARAAAGRHHPAPPVWITRLLGGRLLGQGAAYLAVPRWELTVLGAAVDTMHALSMVGVAAGSHRYRRPALISATCAVAAAAGGLTTVRERRADAYCGYGDIS